MYYMNFLNVVIIFFMLNNCIQKQAEDEVYLIPSGFIGHIIIIFEQSDGEEAIYENGKRVYVIPENGILKSKFKANYGTKQIIFYYIDKLEKRNPIPSDFEFQGIDSTQIDSNQVVYFEKRIVGISKPRQENKIRYERVSIGKISQMDSLKKTRDKFESDIFGF